MKRVLIGLAMSMVLASGELDLTAVEQGVYEAFGYNFGYIAEEIEITGIEFDPWFDSGVQGSCLDPNGGGHQWEMSNIVCDSVEQAKKHWQAYMDDPEREFMIVVNPVQRNPANAGTGVGWRWKKWGPYIGTHEIQHEFLDDEEGIDKVFLASIIQVNHKEV
jgi:hypothetical protein